MHLRAGPQLRTVEGPPFTEWELVLRQEGPPSSELCRPPPHPRPLRRTPYTQRGLQSLHSTQSKAPSSIPQGSPPPGPPAHTRRPSPSAASRTCPSTRPALADALGPHPSLLSVRTLPGSGLGWFSDKASEFSPRSSLHTSGALPHPSPRLNKIDV